jgi:uncharacterized membrane protein
MARHELPDLLQWLVRIDHHPPLYYVLLRRWIGWFGDTPAALRSLSAVAGALAIPPFALAARRLAGARAGIIAAFLLAISPFQLRYAQETRMYSVLTLCVAVVFLSLAFLLTTPRSAAVASTRKWWLLLAIAEAAAMLTHNTATILVPLALNGAVVPLWLAQRRRDGGALEGVARPGFLVAWLASQAVALLLWSPWAWPFLQQARVVANDFWIAPPDLWTVWLALGSLTFAHLPAWMPQRDYLAWLALLLVVWGVWQWRRHAALTWILLALWLIPPSVELLASVRRPIFYDRTLIWTTLPLYLLIALGMVAPNLYRVQWNPVWQRGWSFLMLAVVSALCGLGVWNYFMDFPKERWDQAASFVATEAQPNALILFHASWAELPFDYHYPPGAPALARHGVPADLFDAGTLEPPMQLEDVPRVLELIEGHREVWLVYAHWWYTDPDALLIGALANHREIVEQREWPGIRVIRYASMAGQ